jgi:hypothetical protein
MPEKIWYEFNGTLMTQIKRIFEDLLFDKIFMNNNCFNAEKNMVSI